jgi:hypothetical protein
MKLLAITICAASLLFAACNNEVKKEGDNNTTDSATAKTDSTASTAMPDTAAIMKAWNDFKTPGKEHKLIASWDGTWTAEVNQWMDPAAPPTKSMATMVNKTGYGGLYQISKFTSTMFGAPFEGQSVLGYNNSKKIYVSHWIDNTGSGFVEMTGSWDEGSKTLNLKGIQTNPVTEKDTDIRETFKIIDENTYLMTMYGSGIDGKEMKFMEGTFKRKK